MAKKKKEEKEIVKEEVTPQEQAFDFAEASRADIAAAEEPAVDPTLEFAPSPEKVARAQETIAQEFDKTVEQKPARIQRKEENARKMVDALSAKEEELGRELTRQEIADYADSKGLWAYQSLYNKKGNWADAFGGRDVFGSLNDDTYELIKKDLKARSTHRDVVRKEEERPNRVIGTIKQADGTNRHITRAHQTLHQNLWGEGTDINNMSPEQSSQFIDLLRASGHVIPEEFKVEGNTSMNDLLIDLMPYVDEDELEYEMRKLGYYNGDSLVAPHKETYEEMMARRARAEAEAKLQSEQKALARRQMRLGFADLAAGIGDMIKASGGAKVDPRDYKAMYDSLTQQQQINYNNYLTRLKALEEQEKEKAERARQERLLAERYAREDKLLQEERAWQEKQKEISQQYKMELEAAKAAYKLELKKTQNSGKVSGFKSKRTIVYNGVKYEFKEGSKNSVISSLLSVVKPHFDNDNGYAAIISGIENSQMSDYGKMSETANTVICALEELNLSPDEQAKVQRILSDYAAKETKITSGGGNGTTGKKYKDANGNVITAAAYAKLSPSQKKLYTEVK